MSAVAGMLEQVRRDGLLTGAGELLVLLSGGRDSTCLLHLAATVAGPERVTALHVNYGLRETAGGDERCARQACEALGGLRLHVVHAGAPDHNVQAWARELRYAAARELAAGADIAVGHTAADQVETILYRLASSPSRRALLGMRPREGQIVRPLLAFSREATTEYCHEAGLRWVDDETNSSGRYARNRIRNELLPALRSLHPAADENVLALSETLRDEAELLDELMHAELQGRDRITLAQLRSTHPALARLIVQHLADRVHNRPSPGVARRLPEILALSDHGTARLDLPHRIRASVSAGILSFGETDVKPRDHH